MKTLTDFHKKVETDGYGSAPQVVRQAGSFHQDKVHVISVRGVVGRHDCLGQVILLTFTSPCQSPFTGNQSTWFKAKETIYFCPTSVSSMSFLTSLTMAVPSELDNSASRECSWTALSRRAGWPSLTTYIKFNFWNNWIIKRHNSVSKGKQKQFAIRGWGDFGFIINIIRSSLLGNK